MTPRRVLAAAVAALLALALAVVATPSPAEAIPAPQGQWVTANYGSCQGMLMINTNANYGYAEWATWDLWSECLATTGIRVEVFKHGTVATPPTGCNFYTANSGTPWGCYYYPLGSGRVIQSRVTDSVGIGAVLNICAPEGCVRRHYSIYD